MGYGAYLKELLAPLGVYDLTAGTVSEGELYALGTLLDTVGQRLEAVERESLTATAEGEGLERRESLFARRPVADTAESRRAAIAALLQIDGDSLTPEAINRTIQGCGVRAKALEVDTGHLRVIFPEVNGVPPEFREIEDIVLDILPCHLEVEFYFRYLTWQECESMELTWADVEEALHTWESFELAVPTEEGV